MKKQVISLLLIFAFASSAAHAQAIKRKDVWKEKTAAVFLNSGKNVGIGTSAPTAALDVIGTAKATAFSGPLTGNVTGNVTGTAGNLSGTPALPNGTTATTQSQGDGSTKLATTDYVDTAVSGSSVNWDDMPLINMRGINWQDANITPTIDGVNSWRVSDKDSNSILSVDTTNNRVGIGTTAPAADLHINNPSQDMWGTGGDVTETYDAGGGVYWKYHKFTTVGNWTFVPPSPARDIEYIIVAGGGGGGLSVASNTGAGGGGAGGFLSGTLSSVSSNLSITVGDGGAGATTGTERGYNGEDSVLGALTAVGGGGGGQANNATTKYGNSGGSGGGNGYAGTTSPGSGTSGQGNNGGVGSGTYAGGGGGGAGAVGTAGSGTTGGAGGTGVSSSITGASVCYAGGGGGGTGSGSTAGSATCGGGPGGIPGSNGTAGTDGLGGGGGGGGSSSTTKSGGNGGSGVVILRYKVDSLNLTAPTTIISSGNIAVGKTSANGMLDIKGVSSDGSSYNVITRDSAGTQNFSVDDEGNVIAKTVNASNDILATSFAIGANTLTTSEFGYLDGQDQALKTTSSPAFQHLTVEGVTSTGATGTGKIVFDTNPTITGTWNYVNSASPSAASSFTISGLSDGRYMLSYYWTQNTSASSVYLQFNGDTTSANYTTAAASFGNSADIFHQTGASGLYLNTHNFTAGNVASYKIFFTAIGGNKVFTNTIGGYTDSSYGFVTNFGAGVYSGSSSLSSISVVAGAGTMTGNAYLYKEN